MDFFAKKGLWFRFDGYRKRRIGDGLFITPERGSPAHRYSPLRSKSLLIDLLITAKALGDIEQEKNTALKGLSNPDELNEMYQESREKEADRIIFFFKQYGMLGLFWHPLLAYSARTKEALLAPEPGTVIFPPDREKGLTGWVDYDEYVRYFFPNRIRPRIEKHRSVEFARKYHESVGLVALCFRRLWRMANLLQEFEDSSKSLEQNYKKGVTWKERLEGVWTGVPVRLQLGFDKALLVDYQFQSLLAAIGIKLLLSKGGQEDGYQICALDSCRSPFVPSRPQQKYCIPDHGNVDRVRRHRAGKPKP